MKDKEIKFEWGDIITITLSTGLAAGSSFTVLLEQTGRVSGNSPIQDISGLFGNEVRYATPEEIREFMRGLCEDGRLLHQGYDTINKPSHYASSEIECIDAMESAYGVEAVMHFCLCNSFKYIFRSQKKNGSEDLKKAMWYENKYLELEKKLKENVA